MGFCPTLENLSLSTLPRQAPEHTAGFASWNFQCLCCRGRFVLAVDEGVGAQVHAVYELYVRADLDDFRVVFPARLAQVAEVVVQSLRRLKAALPRRHGLAFPTTARRRFAGFVIIVSRYEPLSTGKQRPGDKHDGDGVQQNLDHHGAKGVRYVASVCLSLSIDRNKTFASCVCVCVCECVRFLVAPAKLLVAPQEEEAMIIIKKIKHNNSTKAAAS